MARQALQELLVGGFALAAAVLGAPKAMEPILGSNVTAEFTLNTSMYTSPNQYVRYFQRGNMLYGVSHTDPKGRRLACYEGLPQVNEPITFTTVTEQLPGRPMITFHVSDSTRFPQLKRECEQVERTIEKHLSPAHKD